MGPTFLITAFVIVATPSTGALLTISAGLARGVRAGLVAAAGCTLGAVALPVISECLAGARA
jgi:threonine/homoserine/homoserine lactone efflux protein